MFFSETHGRVFKEEVPVDRILTFHRGVGVGKDDLRAFPSFNFALV